ncbi:MAG: hypothetical protein MUE44_30125 [Oscillatoriaceae cyanobacterium Prado104]|jgi:hypothetical protein|nr:hypothetical protein [Oscillatoriaceae cyanobacterium Prado104]
MSNGYSGPYQSRLLNFISKQSRQVADKCDRTWREVKLASLNALQVLLYPAYLLVQSSRMLSRQLRESKRQIDLPELQESQGDRENLPANLLELEMDADSAIAGILNLAQNLLLPAQADAISNSISFLINSPKQAATQSQKTKQLTANTANSQTIPVWGSQIAPTQTSSTAAIAAKSQVQGIATSLPAKSLVLVGNKNQILDILTAEQQQLLLGQIVWEVANAGLQRRQIAEKELEFNLGLESAATQAKLPPVRRFWELMAWVQASPIALKRNQFGESILALKQAVEKAVQANSQGNSILTQKSLAPAASAIAPAPSELGANLNSKFDLAPDAPSFVSLLDRTAANIETISLPAVSKNTSELTAPDSGNIPEVSPSAKEILENYARNIEKMIWSSVDYLLGKETAASENTEKALAIKYYLEQQALKNAEKTEQAGERPWLNWQDLFGEPAPEPVGIELPSPPRTSDARGTQPPQNALSQSSAKVKPQIPELEALPEGRVASITPSPYPAAIQTLLAQLKQSLLTTKVPKNQPQNTQKIAIVQQQSDVPKPTATAQQPKPAGHGVTIEPATTRSVSESKTSRSGGTKQEADWLETKAESMGYVKHPLEQALEWLDRIMVQLEKIAEYIWKSAKTYLAKILNS